MRDAVPSDYLQSLAQLSCANAAKPFLGRAFAPRARITAARTL